MSATGQITGGSVSATGQITGGSVSAAGQITGGSVNATSELLANTNLSFTHDAMNGARIVNKTLTNLGIGTNNTATAIQIGATGNVGIGKSPSVALDVNGQVSCASVTVSQGVTAGGDILGGKGGFNTVLPNATLHALTNTTTTTNYALRLSTPNISNNFETVYKIAFGCDAFGVNDSIASIGFNRINGSAHNQGAICFYTYSGAGSGSDLASERMRLDHSGALGLQTTTPNSGYCLGISIGGTGKKNGAINITSQAGTGLDVAQYGPWSAGGWNGNNTILYLSRDSGTTRSLNAYGTVNASGTDYAEYLEKDRPEEVILKGAIVGLKSNGKLTTKWSEAKSFMIKSTNPSYVGGDSWGDVGPRPQRSSEETEASMEAYQNAVEDYQRRLEAERVKYDRVAYSGQVPVNVTGANAGDCIVPAEGEDDHITGVVISPEAITFAEYKKVV